MKKEYDFSKGEHSKFFNQDAELCLPVYLEPDGYAFQFLYCLPILHASAIFSPSFQ